MRPRLLLTGISGFIGGCVMDYVLAHTDWEIVGIASWLHKGEPRRITESDQYRANRARVTIVTHDLAVPISDHLAAGIGPCEFIVNMASSSHVDRSIANPVAFIENNVSSTLNMLEYARRHPPEMFVQFSTDEVYGAAEHAEWDVLLPSNPYAASKAAQEMIAVAYWSTYKVPAVLTNSNNIIGPNQHPEKFVPKICDLIWRGETVVVHTADGRPGRRHYNPVQNVADALLFILRHPQPTTDRPPRFNLPGGEELDNLEMAERIAALMDRPLKYELVDAETVRPGYDQFYPRTEGTLSALGWEPTFTLDQELARLVNRHMTLNPIEGAA